MRTYRKHKESMTWLILKALLAIPQLIIIYAAWGLFLTYSYVSQKILPLFTPLVNLILEPTRDLLSAPNNLRATAKFVVFWIFLSIVLIFANIVLLIYYHCFSYIEFTGNLFYLNAMFASPKTTSFCTFLFFLILITSFLIVYRYVSATELSNISLALIAGLGAASVLFFYGTFVYAFLTSAEAIITHDYATRATGKANLYVELYSNIRYLKYPTRAEVNRIIDFILSVKQYSSHHLYSWELTALCDALTNGKSDMFNRLIEEYCVWTEPPKPAEPKNFLFRFYDYVTDLYRRMHTRSVLTVMKERTMGKPSFFIYFDPPEPPPYVDTTKQKP